MIDKQRRQKLALYLRHLSTGQITNDEFEDLTDEQIAYGENLSAEENESGNDLVITPMLNICRSLYKDTFEHRLTEENQLTPEQLKVVARFIIYLHSGLEYKWAALEMKTIKSRGDFGTWPFSSRLDFEAEQGRLQPTKPTK